MGIQFDFPSIGFGFGAGILTTLATQRAIQYWRDSAEDSTTFSSAGTIRVSSVNRGNRRYTKELLRFCQSNHLLGKYVALTDVLIEPRFIRQSELVAPPSDDGFRNVFDVLPMTHTYPQFYAPFNMPTLSIEDLGKGAKHLILVGARESGRTIALQTIALWALGQINFTQPTDSVAQKIAKEEEKLSPEERAERIKKRILVAQKAREQYRNFLGRTEEEAFEKQKSNDLPRLRQLAPLYIHLANIRIRQGEFGQIIDPAEPLVRGLQRQVSYVTARTMPRDIYRLLKAGESLILIDGLEDVPTSEREEKLAWIQAFIRYYGDNTIIVASQPEGYQSLSEVGFTPIFLRPNTPQHTQDLLEKLLKHWKKINGTTLEPSDKQLAYIAKHAYALNRTELTLFLWATLRGERLNESQQVLAFLASRLGTFEAMMPALQRLATLQLDEGYITLDSLVNLELEDSLQSPLVDTQTTSENKTSNAEKAQEQQMRQITQAQRRLLGLLMKAGILTAYRHKHYRFTLKTVCDVLGASTLTNTSADTLYHKWMNPDWQGALNYANQTTSLDALVPIVLSLPPDMRYSHLQTLVRWLKYAKDTASWRNIVLKLVGNLLLAPNQYSLVREQLAGALLATGDEQTLIIFRRMLKHTVLEVRAIGCLGVGVLKDAEALPVLEELLHHTEEEENVQLCSVFALGAIQTPEAFEVIDNAFKVYLRDNVRRAIAETLALFPTEGYPRLYQAITDEELMVRRATVWGLGRVKKDWSIIAINEVYLSDKEWYVRSAAEQVFQDTYEEERQGVRAYPNVGEVLWVNEWIREQTDAGILPSNIQAIDALKQAIHPKQSNALIRLLGVAIAGQLGVTSLADALYRALYDPEEAIRDSAHRALAELEIRHAQALPNPV